MRKTERNAPMAGAIGSLLDRGVRRHAMTFDDCMARGYWPDWPHDICDCKTPRDNDQGVCLLCGCGIQSGRDA